MAVLALRSVGIAAWLCPFFLDSGGFCGVAVLFIWLPGYTDSWPASETGAR